MTGPRETVQETVGLETSSWPRGWQLAGREHCSTSVTMGMAAAALPPRQPPPNPQQSRCQSAVVPEARIGETANDSPET